MRRFVSGIMLTLLLTGMLTLVFSIQPVKAAISGFEWIEPTYCGYDPLFGTTVVAYRSGSVSNITITVFNNFIIAINISAVKLGFDWGINYSSTEVSSQDPYTLMYNEYHTFRVSFTVPSTSIASTTVLHVFTIWVEYVYAQLNSFWVVSGDNFAVYPEFRTWVVDDDGPADFHTIQEAINAANLGDIVYVHNGTYYENVVVNKSVMLIGEDRSNAIIDGGGTGAVVNVTANNVKISDFTIQNSGYSWDCSGVCLYRSSGNNVSNNIISNHFLGIDLPDYSGYNTISGNIIEDTLYGINLIFSSGNTISDNTVMNCEEEGVSLGYSDNNHVSGNTVTNNKMGIIIGASNGNTLRNNNMTGNAYNFGVMFGAWESAINDVDTSNTVDGKPVYYWVNQNNKQIPADAGCVIVVNSYNITVRDLNLTKNFNGVSFINTVNSAIINVNTSSNYHGIGFYRYSVGNTIIENGISSNWGYGIFIWSYSDSNIVGSNTIANNGWTAISISDSWNNTIYHNNFINNAKQVDANSVNTWDDGYPSGGNYWSDYGGVDLYTGPYQNETGSDGIGDSLYGIDWNNVDRYPLIHPYVPLLGDLNLDRTVDMFDAIQVASAFGTTPEHPNWNPKADLNVDGVIDIFDIIILGGNFGKTNPV